MAKGRDLTGLNGHEWYELRFANLLRGDPSLMEARKMAGPGPVSSLVTNDDSFRGYSLALRSATPPDYRTRVGRASSREPPRPARGAGDG